MSTPGGAGASRGAKAKPTPPLKGSFPLDHFGECKHLMLEYTECMKVRASAAPLSSCRPLLRHTHRPRRLPCQKSSGNSSQCRELSKKYLDCRMTKCDAAGPVSRCTA